MSAWATLKVALLALGRNRLRSLLTALGIIIGIAAFVAMVALGRGLTDRVGSELSALGSNVVIVSRAQVARGGVRGGGSADGGGLARLYLDDAADIATLADVRKAAPAVRTTAQAVWRNANWNTTIFGTTPDYFDVRAWEFARGSSFTDDDVAAAARTCVVGQTVLSQLLDPGLEPVGEVVRINGLACEIVGVLAERGANAFGADEDDVILMPITTAQRRVLGLDRRLIHFIALSVVSAQRTEPAKRGIVELLRRRHRLDRDDEDDFEIRDPKALAARITTVTRLITVGVGALALISLLVGGIGIMNIMLVSVTERTREIGVRIALGARSSDILAQFISEATILSVVGGALGVGLGVAGSTLVGRQLDIAPSVDGASIVLALLFSAAVGLTFGIYPAWRASRLDPIAALRYE